MCLCNKFAIIVFNAIFPQDNWINYFYTYNFYYVEDAIFSLLHRDREQNYNTVKKKEKIFQRVINNV